LLVHYVIACVTHVLGNIFAVGETEFTIEDKNNMPLCVQELVSEDCKKLTLSEIHFQLQSQIFHTATSPSSVTS